MTDTTDRPDEVRRWKCTSYCLCGSRKGHFEAHDEGAWVLYTDALAEIDRLRAEVERLRQYEPLTGGTSLREVVLRREIERLTRERDDAEQRVRDIDALWHGQRDVIAERDQLRAEVERLRTALRDLIRAYVNLLEAGKDRIESLGGDCDPVDMMERADPDLCKARNALSGEPASAPEQTPPAQTETEPVIDVTTHAPDGHWDYADIRRLCDLRDRQRAQIEELTRERGTPAPDPYADQNRALVAEIATRRGITLGHLREDGGGELAQIMRRLDEAETHVERLRGEVARLSAEAPNTPAPQS